MAEEPPENPTMPAPGPHRDGLDAPGAPVSPPPGPGDPYGSAAYGLRRRAGADGLPALRERPPAGQRASLAADFLAQLGSDRFGIVATGLRTIRVPVTVPSHRILGAARALRCQLYYTHHTTTHIWLTLKTELRKPQ